MKSSPLSSSRLAVGIAATVLTACLFPNGSTLPRTSPPGGTARVEALAPSSRPPSPVPLPPQGRVWAGAVPENLWDRPMAQRMHEVDAATGIKHAVFGEFVRFPQLVQDPVRLNGLAGFLNACAARGAIALLTVETFGGLESYTLADLHALADFLKGFRLPILLRWNHEFNGGWYPWGRQPIRYVERFREAAIVFRHASPLVAMVWAPNAQGGGYPFYGDNVHPLPDPGSPDFRLLDTNGNGQIDPQDDGYGPYYPGDDVVDWIGISTYSHGKNPDDHYSLYWNLLPPPGLFLNDVRDLHDQYAIGRRRPMIIAETGAHFHPDTIPRGNASELAIKSSWIDQVYGLEGTGGRTLPGIRAVVWFSQSKKRAVQPGGVPTAGDVSISDKRVHANPAVAAVYRQAIETGPFSQAPAYPPYPEHH